MSPLRKQMDEDMVVRGLAERTREAYLGAVASLAKHYGRRPDRIDEAELLKQLPVLAARFPSVRFVQIDDGYQANIGDWTVTNEKFPRGMGPLAREIKELEIVGRV